MRAVVLSILVTTLVGATCLAHAEISRARLYQCRIVQALNPLQPDGRITERGSVSYLVGRLLYFDSYSGILRIDDGWPITLEIKWHGPNNLIALREEQAPGTLISYRLEIQSWLPRQPFLLIAPTYILSGTCRSN